MPNLLALAFDPLGLIFAVLGQFVARTSGRRRPVPDPYGRQGAAVPTGPR